MPSSPAAASVCTRGCSPPLCAPVDGPSSTEVLPRAFPPVLVATAVLYDEGDGHVALLSTPGAHILGRQMHPAQIAAHASAEPAPDFSCAPPRPCSICKPAVSASDRLVYLLLLEARGLDVDRCRALSDQSHEVCLDCTCRVCVNVSRTHVCTQVLRARRYRRPARRSDVRRRRTPTAARPLSSSWRRWPPPRRRPPS